MADRISSDAVLAVSFDDVNAPGLDSAPVSLKLLRSFNKLYITLRPVTSYH